VFARIASLFKLFKNGAINIYGRVNSLLKMQSDLPCIPRHFQISNERNVMCKLHILAKSKSQLSCVF